MSVDVAAVADGGTGMGSTTLDEGSTTINYYAVPSDTRVSLMFEYNHSEMGPRVCMCGEETFAVGKIARPSCKAADAIEEAEVTCNGTTVEGKRGTTGTCCAHKETEDCHVV